MKFIELQNLYDKAIIYEHKGKEHNPMRPSNEAYKQNDISAHLHCEIVELWLSVVQNQSIEQVIDELADILCIWNLALVLYQDAIEEKVELQTVYNKAIEIINNDNFFKLQPDARKPWKIKDEGNAKLDELVRSSEKFLNNHKITAVFNFGQGNAIDIFALLHKSVNDYWNTIRKQKGTLEIFDELVKVFVVWLIAVKIISKNMKYEISIGNIINIANDIFTSVAKRKFNIDI